MSNLEPLGTGFLGLSLSLLYRGALLIRELRFKLLKPTRFPFPIISVGGISAGGTGKTPLTSVIIDMVIEAGGTPVLFSRGYGRKSSLNLIIEPSVHTNWSEVGDEPSMLKDRHPKLWLAIGGKRVALAKQLTQNLPKNCVGIMDDGFQHRYLHRDLDIVTLPPSLFEESLIPSGLLREPLSALKRADLLIPITTDPLSHSYTEALTTFNLPIIKAHSITPFWKNATTQEQTPFIHEDIALFSGIARPERFINSAQSRCKSVANTTIFDDHHNFSDEEVQRLVASGDLLFGTTEKDIQRLSTNNKAILKNLYYLVVTLELDNSALLISLIASLLRGHYDTGK